MSRLLFLAFAIAPVLGADQPAFGSNAPSVTASIVRMIGALALVIALFFGAAWLFKNGLRMRAIPGVPRKLQILEAKSLGARQAVYVVGYENQRMLIGSTPNGLALLTHLPEGSPEPVSDRIVPVSFGEALMQALGRK